MGSIHAKLKEAQQIAPGAGAALWLYRLLAPSDKGRGLNSIPVRFALLTGLLTGASFVIDHHLHGEEATHFAWPLLLVSALLPAAITYLAANKLASAIRALRESTDAIVAGDLNSPIEVDCACEVGGLADSFRVMIGQINSNIVRMNSLAYSDPVTGLANRSVITHVLGAAAQSNRSHGALLFIDLDNFKKVNDTLGHKAGDELLRIVSDRIVRQGFGLNRNEIDDCRNSIGELSTSFPQRPVFARYAGDEFVALLPGGHDQAELEERARRVIEAVSSPFIIHGTEVRVSASVGIARMPVDTRDAQQLLNYADLAMYAAKEGGKNRYRFFDHSLKELALERSHIEQDLRKAIEYRELSLNFQPKVNVRTMQLEGVEALVRWDHPIRGRVAPDAFIEIAEQRGLMPDLGNCVLNMALRQAREWLDQGISMPVAINVSAAQFEHLELVPDILTALDQYQVDPSLIEIEITETMVMSDFARTQDRMSRLRAAGVHISIDDFGTGFSNLSQLSRLPFSVLKVDKSLIADIGQNPKSEAIIKAIVHMAHALGHQVVAEGIELPEQHVFVRRLGCDLAQGYLFGAAMPAEDLPNWMETLGNSQARFLQERIRERLSVNG